ncbi:MAG: hypothetical protein EOP06_14455 [Proteobacteria bacterium]|nr:MAG: hypothetical protein EOP06_14455 [Pseudomonadota bacterium]
MPDERTKALLLAGELLTKLASSVRTPDVPDAIRKQAQHILRHYPSRSDIGYLAEDAERGAFIAGPMLDATVARTKDGIQNPEPSENQRKTPLERLADNAEPVLIFIAIAFTLCALYLILSLTCKIGSSFC